MKRHLRANFWTGRRRVNFLSVLQLEPFANLGRDGTIAKCCFSLLSFQRFWWRASGARSLLARISGIRASCKNSMHLGKQTAGVKRRWSGQMSK
jgi:hypothetical protein